MSRWGLLPGETPIDVSGLKRKRTMREKTDRRFNLGDAMAMIAAVTPGLLLIRTGIGFGLFEIGKLTEAGGQPSSLARQFVEFFNVGGGCVLAGLVPPILILGLYRAQPSRLDAAQGPGLIACFIALASAFLPISRFTATVLVESRLPYPSYSVAFNNVFGRWMMAAGPMVLGAWLASFWRGAGVRVRPGRTGPDVSSGRASC